MIAAEARCPSVMASLKNTEPMRKTVGNSHAPDAAVRAVPMTGAAAA
jgi:hypothetical protein